MPIAFCTAIYGLMTNANLKKREVQKESSLKELYLILLRLFSFNQPQAVLELQQSRLRIYVARR